ncbi:ral guanine nucleotide dissociation stimulator-like [Neofelis nebulosa]|uniref:ral guanine nucleotide dissociation stimulator-like n=1 Tax=Neofelis nebulosa TaxID=61452 RepID=UPI00272A17C1|nr:ral guanine nucleotide dissociation stimulator-like [Neofelis nebulosa]
MYRAFATTQQVLELLFMRYGCFLPDTEEDGGPRKQEKMAISSILGTWLDHYPEDFFQPPYFISQKMLQAYVGTHMPGSELQHHTRLLYSTWRNCEPNESESLATVPAPERDPDVPQELAPAISVVPTGTSQPRLPEATTHSGAQQLEEAVTLPSASPPVQVVVPALIHCQELEEPPAPLVDPQPEQPPAPAGGVMEGLEQPPATAEQQASAPEQHLMLAAAPKDECPDPVIALLVIFVVCIENECNTGGAPQKHEAPHPTAMKNKTDKSAWNKELFLGRAGMLPPAHGCDFPGPALAFSHTLRSTRSFVPSHLHPPATNPVRPPRALRVTPDLYLRCSPPNEPNPLLDLGPSSSREPGYNP